MKHTIKKLPKSQVEIEIEVPSGELEDFISHAKEHLAEHLKVDGFRPGNVPKEMVEAKVGAEQILAEAADMAVNHAYKKVVTENNLEPIAHPEVQIVKLAQGNPFIFKITVNVLPEVELADYKKIASQAKIKEVFATEEETKDSLEYIRKTRAKYSQLERPAQEKDFVEIEYESPELNLGNKIYPVKSAESGVPPKAEQFNRVKDMGKVMQEVMPKVKGKADGGLVSKIVRELLET